MSSYRMPINTADHVLPQNPTKPLAGMPLTMNPNFEDFSCEMVFGAVPPPLEQDPVALQPCLAACPSAAAPPASDVQPAQQPRCPKLD